MILIWRYEYLHIFCFYEMYLHTLYIFSNKRCMAAKKYIFYHSVQALPTISVIYCLDNFNHHCSITDKSTQSCCLQFHPAPHFVYTVDFYLENLQDLLISSLPNKAGCSKYRQLALVLSYNLLRLSCVQLITLHIILQQHK